MSEHIYNVTIAVDPAIEQAWKKWMIETHIPEVMHTGMFKAYLFTQVHPEQDQEHPSYSVQYRASDLESIKLYMQMYAPDLRDKTAKAWGNHALAFRTILEVIKE
jgi:hypothetical protein